MNHQCENCGNIYQRTFEVIQHGISHEFDSFECAINKLAPRCGECGTIVLGHGLEKHSKIYCCANCAREDNVQDLKDHS